MHKLNFAMTLSLVCVCAFAISALMPARAQADQLILYVYSSPRPIHWETPRSLLMSTVENELLSIGSKYAHSIGHVNVELQCGETAEGPAIQEYAGMTSAKGYNPLSLILKGYAMGVLFQNFPGTLETQERVTREIRHGERSGRMNFVKFLIAPKTCHRLHAYLTEYKERGYSKNYGLPNRPRYGEGAGCSAFGVSFVDIAGILSDDLVQAWSLNLNISEKLIGGPLTGQKVALRKILFDRAGWSTPITTEAGSRMVADTGAKELFFWDPDTMYQWVKKSWKETPPVGFEKVSSGKSLGLVTDATQIPTPADPIWKN